MIGVDKIGQIRRAYFEQQRSIKEIVRTLSVSRATVRKVIRGHKTEFKYERGVQPTPKLGDWVEVLTEILEQEAKLPKRERRSTQRLFEELRGRGYAGAHDSVHRFVKAWRDERVRVPVQAYVPMSFAPGEAYQFDWWRPARGTLATPRTLSDQTIRSLSWDAESYFGYSEYPSRSSFSSYCSSIIDECGSELEFRQRNAPPRRRVSRCLIFVLFLDDDRVIIRFVLLYNRGAAPVSVAVFPNDDRLVRHDSSDQLCAQNESRR